MYFEIKCVYTRCIWRGIIVCGSIGDKRYILCKWCKGMLERIFGKDCGRFGGFGFDGFEVSGILLKKIIKKSN